jgi:predicted TIM-barrel fold metal-dependent hydrolase
VDFDFVDVPVIDGHIHFGHPERMADILGIMGRVPLAGVNLVSVSGLARPNQNPALIHFKAHDGDRVYLSGGLDYVPPLAEQLGSDHRLGDLDWSAVDPDRMSAELGAQVAALRSIGFDGLKLIEGKPTMRKMVPMSLDAVHYAGMWEALERLDMPVVFHVADPEEFWEADLAPSWAKEHGWFYGDGTFPTKEALYREVDNILARHPTLKLVFAHFYFLSADLDRAADFLDRHPSVCFDLTPGNEMISNFTRNFDVARDFFIRYSDRLVYGTDIATWGLGRTGGMAHALWTSWAVRMYLEKEGVFEPPEALAHWREPDLHGFRGFALPPEVLERIYHSNFERLFGSVPAPLNRDAALVELARMADQIDRQSVGEEAANPARQVLEALQEM